MEILAHTFDQTTLSGRFMMKWMQAAISYPFPLNMTTRNNDDDHKEDGCTQKRYKIQ